MNQLERAQLIVREVLSEGPIKRPTQTAVLVSIVQQHLNDAIFEGMLWGFGMGIVIALVLGVPYFVLR